MKKNLGREEKMDESQKHTECLMYNMKNHVLPASICMKLCLQRTVPRDGVNSSVFTWVRAEMKLTRKGGTRK